MILGQKAVSKHHPLELIHPIDILCTELWIFFPLQNKNPLGPWQMTQWLGIFTALLKD